MSVTRSCRPSSRPRRRSCGELPINVHQRATRSTAEKRKIQRGTLGHPAVTLASGYSPNARAATIDTAMRSLGTSAMKRVRPARSSVTAYAIQTRSQIDHVMSTAARASRSNQRICIVVAALSKPALSGRWHIGKGSEVDVEREHRLGSAAKRRQASNSQSAMPLNVPNYRI
jgi:hypothetical protein